MKVLYTIHDTDYLVWKNGKFESDSFVVGYESRHGIVVFVSGLIDEDSDIVMCLGSENERDFSMALHPLFDKFKYQYYKTIRRRDLLEDFVNKKQ